MPPLETVGLGELGHALRIAAILLGLGLAMAFSPTTFGIEIGAVEGSRDARQRVLVIAAAVAAASTLLALLFLVINPTALHALWTGKLQPIVEQRWVDGVVGLVLVTVGIVQWRRAAVPRREKHSQSRLDRPGPLFLFVLAESLVSTTGPATMYLVVHNLSTIRPAALWPIGYLVFLVALVAPYVFLGIAVTRIPSAARWLSRLQSDLASRDLRRPIAVALMIAGALLVFVSVLGVVRTRSPAPDRSPEHATDEDRAVSAPHGKVVTALELPYKVEESLVQILPSNLCSTRLQACSRSGWRRCRETVTPWPIWPLRSRSSCGSWAARS